MKTYLDCIACFLRQALKASRLCTDDITVQEQVMKSVIKEISSIDLNKTPPEFARTVYTIVSEKTGSDDPYIKIKERDNSHALQLLKNMKETVNRSNDSLLTALKLAAASNIMDFAANSSYDLKSTMDKCLASDFAVNDYGEFRKEIAKAKHLVYIADNAGEIVFDKLLIDKIRDVSQSKITFFVKESPIINDATEKDAKAASIDKISNLDIKTVGLKDGEMKKESPKFDALLKSADLVISKGQGNYESFSESRAKIYFILIVKCNVVARHLGAKVGDMILKSGEQLRMPALKSMWR